MATHTTVQALAVVGSAALVLTCSGTAQATYTAYRQSCPSSVGVPQLAAGAPVVGSNWTLTVDNLRPNTAGALFYAWRDDVLGSYSLPLDLGFLGAPACFLNVNSDPASGAATIPLASDAAGLAVATLAIPNLVGVTFHNQYVSLAAPTGRALPITMTNAGRGVVGLYGFPIELVPIAAGSFRMGSNASYPVERPVHTVNITRPFWIGKYEVTQVEYQAVIGTNPSYFSGANRPVETVSWDDAMAYCAALTVQEAVAGRLPSGYQYRLPTEAEWEYCCRAGTTTEWNTGASLSCGQANSWGLPGGSGCVGQTTDVGSYAPNAWGLYDTHGNVLEWCLDHWDGSANYPSGPVSDPYVTSGRGRLHRGGSWYAYTHDCRSASRSGFYQDTRTFYSGFRVVLAPVLVP